MVRLISCNLRIAEFLEAVKDKTPEEIITLAVQEEQCVERLPNCATRRDQHADFARDQYDKQLGNLWYFVSYRARPGDMTVYEFQVFLPLAEHLIESGHWPASVLAEFGKQ